MTNLDLKNWNYRKIDNFRLFIQFWVKNCDFGLKSQYHKSLTKSRQNKNFSQRKQLDYLFLRQLVTNKRTSRHPDKDDIKDISNLDPPPLCTQLLAIQKRVIKEADARVSGYFSMLCLLHFNKSKLTKNLSIINGIQFYMIGYHNIDAKLWRQSFRI